MGNKKPLLLSLSAMKKLLLPPPCLTEVRVLSLLAALLFACGYAGLASNNIRDGGTSSCQSQAPSWLLQYYEVASEADGAASRALARGLVWCSAAQAAAAAPALLLLLARRSRGLRALALVALSAAAANHWMYVKTIGILRAGNPGNLSLAVETVAILFAAALDLLGVAAFLLGGE